MRVRESISGCLVAVLLAVPAAVLPGCDSAPGAGDGTLVIEAFFDAGRPLPSVRVGQTVPVNRPADAPGSGLSDAVVTVTLDGAAVPYESDPEVSGLYRPAPENADTLVEPGAGFFVRVRHDDREASATGFIPPRLDLTDISVEVADGPISAVFVDTLDIGLDSLNLAINARQGYIYPVEVSVEWGMTPPGAPDDPFWIEARLTPVNPFSSTLIDFFLLPEQIFREDESRIVAEPIGGSPQERTWSGVYAVPVERENDPLPVHDLRISLLRSSSEYARFATSKTDPRRREPVSNVDGGIGFVGGISVDSVTVTVR